MEVLSAEIGQSIWLTVELAAISTAILLVLATPLAWWLARAKGWWTEIIASVVALPLVLPPTVLGFYLLVLLGPDGPGGWIASLWGGRTLAFTFEGLVIGSVVYSMPFVVQPIRNAFAAMGERPLEVAATLRASPLRTFWTVAVPLARPGFLTGAVLGFAHTVGEQAIDVVLRTVEDRGDAVRVDVVEVDRHGSHPRRVSYVLPSSRAIAKPIAAPGQRYRGEAVQRAGADDAALLHQHQVIGKALDLRHVVADIEYRQRQRLVQLLEERENLVLGRVVERGQRLVHQKEFWL